MRLGLPADYERFMESLRRAVRQCGGAAEVARRSRVPKRTLDGYLRGEYVVPMDRALAIMQATLSSGEWAHDDNSNAAETVHEVREPMPPYGASAGQALVPLYATELGAGRGVPGLGDEIIGFRAFDREWLTREVGAPIEALCTAIVRGDSMEPTLHSGDIVLIDRRDQGPARDDIYALLLDGEVRCKRLQRTLGGLRVLSDNPRYPEETVTRTELPERGLSIIGRVVWWGHLNAA